MFVLLTIVLFFTSALCVNVDHKREYQMQIFANRFINRELGVSEFLAYLKGFEANPKFNYTLNVTSGYQEIIHEKRYDTLDEKLDAKKIDLKVRLKV